MNTDPLESVQCICGEAICCDWQPDAQGHLDLVTYAPEIRRGQLVLHPTDRCPRCHRLLTYQWFAGALKAAQEAVAL